MSEFNFKSQICTTREQSERLLSLGLKKETADMVYTNASLPYNEDVFHLICKEYSQLNKAVNYEISPFTFIPAWSLHRLMSLLKDYNITFIDNVIIVDKYKAFQKCYEFWDDVYDNFIDCIEWLIKEGYFNKEYLV